MLQVTINNEKREVEDGASILDALRSTGVEVPTLCHDDRLRPYGGCRLCVVQVKGWPRPVTACNTLVAEGMVIDTHTPEIEALRRTLISLLAQYYPASAMRQHPDEEFHSLVRAYGLEGELRGSADPALVDDSHPYIHVNMSRCVYCYRCVRICEELQGQFVWKAWFRGDATRIRPDSGTTLLESSCVGCGACADTCPTGALKDKTLLSLDTPTTWTKTTCPYCGTGCEMEVGTHADRIVSIRPVREAPVSRGHLCVKGRYGFDFVYAGDRITEPMIREGGDWKRVSWNDAISFAAEGLRRVTEKYGPDSLGVLGSARATNEENYLTQKFARVVMGTNNVDCCARVCHAPTAAAMKSMLGTGAATNSFDDIEQARTILICGANPTENHPIIGARIKQAVINGASLIVIDPRRIELAEYADYHLQLRPGTNVPLLNALACAIVEDCLYDQSFINERVLEWEEFREFIKGWTPERAESICGVEAALIRKAARAYATGKPAMGIHGLGVTEHTQGTEGVMCLVNLALLTGNIGGRGAGVNPLRGQNNVQGAAHMGCDPSSLTGATSLEDGSSIFESVWQAPVPKTRGLNLLEMMDAAKEGKLKALWAIGYDILLTNPDARSTARALRNLELLIVQDMFLNETAKEFGTVFLPACSSFEKDGTFMNAERRIQRVRKVLEPVGRSKADWEIICMVARSSGKGVFFDYDSPREIWDEIRSVWEAGSGITYGRLDQRGLQWPCPSEDHPGTSVLHAETFPVWKRAALRRIEYRPTPELTDEEFPFILMTGRTLYQFNAGTMTMRTGNTVFRPTDFLDTSPEDAERLGFSDGETARVRSRYGECRLPVRINSMVKPGQLFATFHTSGVFLNKVTGPNRDPYAKTPEYKVTAVALEKLAPK
ncbi:MAG TPA: formate dehydrogenase subunit alpha [Blastocatellia bacterium]|nr:formate dehydrogenase subunit alpha [Blastocatellia bacterium]